MLKDGMNAKEQAMDFEHFDQPTKAGEAVNLTTVPDCGFAARFELVP